MRGAKDVPLKVSVLDKERIASTAFLLNNIERTTKRFTFVLFTFEILRHFISMNKRS